LNALLGFFKFAGTFCKGFSVTRQWLLLSVWAHALSSKYERFCC